MRLRGLYQDIESLSKCVFCRDKEKNLMYQDITDLMASIYEFQYPWFLVTG
jgi:hypothetical protein